MLCQEGQRASHTRPHHPLPLEAAAAATLLALPGFCSQSLPWHMRCRQGLGTLGTTLLLSTLFSLRPNGLALSGHSSLICVLLQ